MKTIKELEKEDEGKDCIDFSKIVHIISGSSIRHLWEEYFAWLELQAQLSQTKAIKKMIEGVIRALKVAQTCKGVDMGKTDAQIIILNNILSELKGEKVHKKEGGRR